MRIIAIIALTLPLTGCYTETHIKRTVTRADGSTEIYENNSHGYNYNPNYTGHWDNTTQINANSNNTQAFSGQFPPLFPPNSQFNVN